MIRFWCHLYLFWLRWCISTSIWKLDQFISNEFHHYHDLGKILCLIFCLKFATLVQLYFWVMTLGYRVTIMMVVSIAWFRKRTFKGCWLSIAEGTMMSIYSSQRQLVWYDDWGSKRLQLSLSRGTQRRSGRDPGNDGNAVSETRWSIF